MKIERNKIPILIISTLTLIVLTFSCNKLDSEMDFSSSSDEHFIDINQVNKITQLNGLPTTLSYSTDLKKVKSKKIVKSINPINNNDDIIDYYIINYEDGGFLILSADNRLLPILAYSETSEFPVETIDKPAEVLDWMKVIDKKINDIRKENKKQEKYIKKAWDILDGRLAPDPDDTNGDGVVDENDGCQDTHVQVGPLLNTKWGQYGFYNDLVPRYCASLGDQAYIGCVAVAMGQFMCFHEYPDSYNWSLIKAYDHNEIAKLLYDAAESVNMDYGCDISLAYTSDVPAALANIFGYPSSTYTDFNYQTVYDKLRLGHPIIMRGSGPYGGHAWVCDGYVKSTYCEGASPVPVFHMNFGWFGLYDGFYSYYNIDPYIYSLDDGKKMIIF